MSSHQADTANTLRATITGVPSPLFFHHSCLPSASLAARSGTAAQHSLSMRAVPVTLSPSSPAPYSFTVPCHICHLHWTCQVTTLDFLQPNHRLCWLPG